MARERQQTEVLRLISHDSMIPKLRVFNDDTVVRSPVHKRDGFLARIACVKEALQPGRARDKLGHVMFACLFLFVCCIQSPAGGAGIDWLLSSANKSSEG